MNNPFFQLQDLRFNLDGKRQLKVNLSLSQGQMLQITGRSGGGKTTLLRVIALLTARMSGEIFLNGRESRAIHPWEWRRQVCYLAQKPTMLPGTVEDNLALPMKLKIAGKNQYQCDKCAQMLEKLGLEGDILKKDASVISGGEASRVALVRALQSQPKVILADEITAPLDEENARLVVIMLTEWVKGQNRGLIFIAHQAEIWNDVRCCTTEIGDFQM